MARVAIMPPRAPASRLAALAAIAALFVAGGAAAQAQPRDQERSEPRPERPERPARDSAAPRPDAETPASPVAHVRVLTEREKRCRQAQGCAMQGPCAPCDR